MPAHAGSQPARAAQDRRGDARTKVRVAADVTPLDRAARAPLWPVVLVLVCCYAPFVGARLLTHDAYWFVHVGRQMLAAGHSSRVLTPKLGWQSEVGYDGQYYYALAADPRHAKDYIPDSIVGFVYSRPLYPALARLVSAGDTAALPVSMLILNLAAVVGATIALAEWLRRRALSPSLSLLYGLFPGLIFCVFRDLTEPVAVGLAAAAWLLLDTPSRRGSWAAAGLLACAGLTRETALVFAVPAALILAEPDQNLSRRWRRPAAFLVASVSPLLICRLVVNRLVQAPTQEHTDGYRSLIPFHGIASYWPWDRQHVLIAVTVILPTVIALAGLPRLLCGPGTRSLAILLALNAAAFVVFLPREVEIDYGAAGRAALGVVLASILCLPQWISATRFSAQAAAVVLSWSLLWFVAAGLVVGIPGLALITS